jgi:large subunit ribosomal protein L25
MIREVQRHHVSYKPLAVDLLAIRLDQKIKIDVPLEVIGGTEVKKQGGILEILHRSLPIKCLPTAIPARIVVDASMLLIGHSLHLADVALPEGIEVDLPRDYPLCTAVTIRAEEEAKPAAEAETAEGEAAAAPAEGEKAEKKEEPKGKEKKEEKQEKK